MVSTIPLRSLCPVVKKVFGGVRRNLRAPAEGLDIISRWLAPVGAVAILVMTFFTLVDVSGREFFDQAAVGAIEVNEAAMVLVVFSALAYTQVRLGHVRVEAFLNRLRPKTRASLEIFSLVLSLAFFAFFVFATWHAGVQSWQIGEYRYGTTLRFPIWPVRFFLPLGSFMLCLVFVIQILRHISELRGANK